MNVLEFAKNGLTRQLEGLNSLLHILDKNFETIATCLANCKGRIIISGVGKSGHIGKKISSTMSSIGLPSFFIHPSEASHGDLGMLMKHDILILISNSGETKEFGHLLQFIANENYISIAITRSDFSTLANATKYKIILPKISEIISYGAPTTSTTQTLVIGDLLAVSASFLKGFEAQDYAKIHPGGKLGLSLTTAGQVMKKREECSIFKKTDHFGEIVSQIKFGVAIIEDSKGYLFGLVTDGDIRKIVATHMKNLANLNFINFVSKNPIVIEAHTSLVHAIEIFNEKKIGVILVIEKHPKGNKVIGIIDRKDLEF